MRSSMTARLALLPLFLGSLIAQTLAPAPTPPPEIDKALRDRAQQFFQYQIDGKFTKAFEMVAEDTKEEYFNSGKSPIKSFQLGLITYNSDFTKATVALNVTRNVNM